MDSDSSESITKTQVKHKEKETQICNEYIAVTEPNHNNQEPLSIESGENICGKREEVHVPNEQVQLATNQQVNPATNRQLEPAENQPMQFESEANLPLHNSVPLETLPSRALLANCQPTFCRGDESHECAVERDAASPVSDIDFAEDVFDDPEDEKFLSELASTSKNSKEPKHGNLKRKPPEQEEEPSSTKRLKKHVQFDKVTVYYFRRMQGFVCVPSQGGSTLGMAAAHARAARFTLPEHAAEQRRARRLRLQQLRAERLLAARAAHSDSDSEASSTQDSDPELDAYHFLQPVPARRRRALLRAAGVRDIDPAERDECRALRASREMCGCSCTGVCAAPACACATAGISCQVDRIGFPCACVAASCSNPAGRVEFNPLRVQTHLVRTLVALGLEPDGPAPPPPPPALPTSAVAPPPSYAYAEAMAHGLCELSYRYADVRSDGYHTYPLASFEEFAHPTHVSMFSDYTPQCQGGGGAAAGVLVPSADSCAWEVSNGVHTHALQPSPSDAQEVSENAENFGEIIKKTMLESVSG